MTQTSTQPETVSPADPHALAPSPPTAPVSVVILTHNEEVNIADCLRSCEWCDDVHVVDSGSTDRTVEIARSMGAKVYHHPFESFGKQRNWAIENCPCVHDWIFHLDADERFTHDLVSAMRDLIASAPAQAGYHIPQKFLFMGKWLKRAAVYPTYQMRLFHKSRMRFCDWGHGQRELTGGEVGVLDVPYLHYGLSKGLSEWIDRHNRYSTAEAIQAFEILGDSPAWRDVFSRDPIRRRRAYKDISYRLPFRASIRHVVTLWVLGAAWEGRPGRTYAQLLNLYERMITLKLRLLRERASRRAGQHIDFERDTLPRARTLPPPPDDGLGRTRTGSPDAEGAVNGSVRSPSPHAPAPGATTIPAGGVERATGAGLLGGPTPADADHLGGSGRREAQTPEVETRGDERLVQLTPESTPWTFRQQVFRAIWMLVGKPIFRMSFHNWYRFRAMLLRVFGAQVGRDVRIRPSVNIEVPWNLVIHDGVTVGDYAILYSLGRIEIGERTIVSQYAHLCAGTHDYTDRRFPLIRDPIIIGADAWIGADAFVGPNVRIGRLSVLGARSSAYKNLEPQMVYVGSPARPIKKRELH